MVDPILIKLPLVLNEDGTYSIAPPDASSDLEVELALASPVGG